MKYLRIRTITIDVNPTNPDQYISLNLEKVALDDDNKVVQVIGGFDIITRKLSDLKDIDITPYAVDGILTHRELFDIVAKYSSQWISDKHGGFITHNNIVVVE
jgi:hypothetical protein